MFPPLKRLLPSPHFLVPRVLGLPLTTLRGAFLRIKLIIREIGKLLGPLDGLVHDLLGQGALGLLHRQDPSNVNFAMVVIITAKHVPALSLYTHFVQGMYMFQSLQTIS